MMDFRQRLEQSRNTPVSSDTPLEPDDHFSSVYFATARSGSPACLDLRFADGSRKAMPYAYFTEMSYAADKGIEILTTTKRIRISGRKLAVLYDSLLAYRVRYIQANIGSDDNEDGVFVRAIYTEETG